MGKKMMNDCEYPDCENCKYCDCTMSMALIRKMVRKRKELAGISCRKCPAYIPEDPDKKMGKFFCLVHLRSGVLNKDARYAPNWCTAGCSYTDEKIKNVKLIAKVLKENRIRL